MLIEGKPVTVIAISETKMPGRLIPYNADDNLFKIFYGSQSDYINCEQVSVGKLKEIMVDYANRCIDEKLKDCSGLDFLTRKGKLLYLGFEENYENELRRLREIKDDPDYTDGWCIIDDSRYVKTLEDVCGILLFGEGEHAIDHVKEFIRFNGDNDIYDLGYTAKTVLRKLQTYFTVS